MDLLARLSCRKCCLGVLHFQDVGAEVDPHPQGPEHIEPQYSEKRQPRRH